MIGIIAALDCEIELIKQTIEVTSETKISNINYITGKYAGKEIVCAVCGVGKVFAAICVQIMILEYHPTIIIGTGVGGTLAPNTKVLDCIVADRLVQHDMDTSPIGDPPGLVSGINIIYFESDKEQGEILLQCMKEQGVNAEFGTIATGDIFVSTQQKKNEIIERFNASMCDMESAAMAQVCYISGTPYVAVRTASDSGDEKSGMDYFTFRNIAAKNSAKAVCRYIEKTQIK